MYYKVFYNEKSEELIVKKCKDDEKVSKKECELHNAEGLYKLTVKSFNVEHAAHLFWLKYRHGIDSAIMAEEMKEFENKLFKTKED